MIISIMQMAIGPAILISAVGLLLLTMTNRLGRAVDRARALAHEPAAAPQLDVLWARAKILRQSILWASFSALTSAVLVITLFVTALIGFSPARLIAGLFIVSSVALIMSLVLFMRDVNLALTALGVELADRSRRMP